MKILHLGKHYWPERGGIETAVKQLAEIGVDFKAKVVCRVSAKKKMKQQPFLPIAESINAVEVIRYPALFHVWSAPVVPQLFLGNLNDFDIVHIHLPHPMAELSLLKQFLLHSKQTQIVPYLHALPIKQGIFGKIWFSLITRIILNRSRKILISNQNIPMAFTRLLPWTKKFAVVPFFTECISASDLQIWMPKRKKLKTVLALGRLVSYKGFDVLIKAWAVMIEADPALREYKLEIAGEGPEKENLRYLISDLKLSHFVHLIGALSEPDKESKFREATVYVAPSVSDAETFGISILEALAHGLPVVTTRLNTGVSILSRNGECGAVANPGSIAELASALKKVLSFTEAEYDQCSLKNLEFASTHYSKQICAKAYHNLLNDSTTRNDA